MNKPSNITNRRAGYARRTKTSPDRKGGVISPSKSKIQNSKLKTPTTAFTLIELLTALTITTLLLSAVYGTYFATIASIDRSTLNTPSAQNAKQLLTRIAAQIRCAYPNQTNPDRQGAGFLIPPPNTNNNLAIHLVSTKSILFNDNPDMNLIEIKYRLNPQTNQLQYRQSPYPSTKNQNWTPIANNVHSLIFQAYNGQQWLNHWNDKITHQLPRAIKITLTITNKNNQQTPYTTTTQILAQHPNKP